MRAFTSIHLQGEEIFKVTKSESTEGCYYLEVGEYGDFRLFLHDGNAKRLVMALVEEMTRGEK